MQRNVFGTLHPFFESGHINGRTIASAGFMAALLQRDPFSEYHFFVAHPDALAEHLRTLPLHAVQRDAVRCLHRTALPQYLRREAYGVFHFADPVSDYVPLCQARNAWAPTIFPVTTVNHTISYSHYANAFLQHLWQGVSSRDAIGCNSHAAKAVMERYFSHLQAHYGTQVCSHAPCLHVVPMGVDTAPLPTSHSGNPASLLARNTMRASLKLAETTVLLLLFGRIALADKMDPIPLLLALRRAKADRPELDMRLVMAGYCGPEDTAPDYLRAVATMLGITCQIIPNPSDAEKHDLYAAADIFVSPSDNIQETFGLSLLEAGAAHLPTVASDWNGYRDIIVHGSTGLLVPTMAPATSPELDMLGPLLFDNQHHLLRSQQSVVFVPAMTEALVTLAQDPALRASMGRQAHSRVMAHFTWDRVVDTWLGLWEELRNTPLSPAEEQRLRGERHTARACYDPTRGVDSPVTPPAVSPVSCCDKDPYPTHPALLPMGAIYAPYATSTPSLHMEVRCSAVGEALRKGTLPFAAFTTLGDLLPEKSLLTLLVWARKAISLNDLLARAMPTQQEAGAVTGQQTTKAPSADAPPPIARSPEQFLFYVLWAIKHDLLVLCNECHLSPPQPRNP